MRNHRLRDRRLKLGLSQSEVGYLANFQVSNAQVYVSRVERGYSPAKEDAVRRALIWFEQAPRRQRAADRAEQGAVAATEAALLLNREDVILKRLIDLLMEHRCEDFDVLAERVDVATVMKAGEQYLDLCTPVIT